MKNYKYAIGPLNLADASISATHMRERRHFDLFHIHVMNFSTLQTMLLEMLILRNRRNK